MYYDFTVISKSYATHNILSLEIESEKDLPEMQISSYIIIFNSIGFGKPQTPIRQNKNRLELLIKVYEGGRVSSFCDKLSVGSKIQTECFFNKRSFTPGEFQNVLMIAGGTGITPMLQILNVDKTTNYHLINSNHTEKDIVKIDFNPNVKVTNVVNKRMDLEMLKEIIRDYRANYISSNFDFIYVCGPPGMMKDVCGPKTPEKEQGELSGMLKELWYTKEQVYKF